MRVEEGVVTKKPWATREACANGHRWTRENTRWRIRTDKSETYPTRDCLACKRKSEGERRKRRAAERNYR